MFVASRSAPEAQVLPQGGPGPRLSVGSASAAVSGAGDPRRDQNSLFLFFSVFFFCLFFFCRDVGSGTADGAPPEAGASRPAAPLAPRGGGPCPWPWAPATVPKNQVFQPPAPPSPCPGCPRLASPATGFT